MPTWQGFDLLAAFKGDEADGAFWRRRRLVSIGPGTTVVSELELSRLQRAHAQHKCSLGERNLRRLALRATGHRGRAPPSSVYVPDDEQKSHEKAHGDGNPQANLGMGQ